MNYFIDRQSICQRVLPVSIQWRSVAEVTSSRARNETTNEKFTNWREIGAKRIDTHGRAEFNNSWCAELIRMPWPAPTENSATSVVATAATRQCGHSTANIVLEIPASALPRRLFLTSTLYLQSCAITSVFWCCIVYSTDFLISAAISSSL